MTKIQGLRGMEVCGYARGVGGGGADSWGGRSLQMRRWVKALKEDSWRGISNLKSKKKKALGRY